MLTNFDGSLPVRDIFRKIWYNMFEYTKQHTADFQYCEQFANSPYTSLVDKEEIDQLFLPIMKVLQRGIEQKIIKDIDFNILAAFIYYPILTLANSRIFDDFEKNEANIEAAFTLAWDAIKL